MSYLLLQGDARRIPLADGSVHCVVTSPPYWGLRDYGTDRQIGLETTLDDFLSEIVHVFREVRRVVRADGTLWVNFGDCYANDGKWGGETGGKQSYLSDSDRKRVGREKRTTGLKPKDLIGIPWRVALALQADGWWLRSDIIWEKPSVMPESVSDRPSRSHEYLFLLTKNSAYFYDAEAIKEPISPKTLTVRTTPRKGSGRESTGEKMNAWMEQNGGRYHPETRNKRTVWTVAARAFPGAHFSTFPPKLIEPCIKAGCPLGGIVLDPFGGACTTAVVAEALGRHSIIIDLNPDYLALGKRRLERPHASLVQSVDDHKPLPLFGG